MHRICRHMLGRRRAGELVVVKGPARGKMTGTRGLRMHGQSCFVPHTTPHHAAFPSCSISMHIWHYQISRASVK